MTIIDFFNVKDRSAERSYNLALFGLTIMCNPDAVLDIGTNIGVSCLSMALAVKELNKPFSIVHTFDIDHSLWYKRTSKYKNVIKKYDIDINKINIVTGDFKQHSPENYLKNKSMIFCDIHDNEGTIKPSSEKFINEWIPQIKEGIIAVHDIVPCEPDWERPKEWGTPPSFSKAVYNNQTYWGFGECKTFLDYLNENNAAMIAIPDTSIIYFRVKDGKPV